MTTVKNQVYNREHTYTVIEHNEGQGDASTTKQFVSYELESAYNKTWANRAERIASARIFFMVALGQGLRNGNSF